MDLTQVDSPRGAKRRRLSRGVVLAVAVATCAALLTPSLASAHIKDKNLRQRYLASVAGWAGTMNSYNATIIQFELTLNNLVAEMKEVIPPENQSETETGIRLALTADDLYLDGKDWADSILSATPNEIRGWTKSVRPCFTTAADKRALNKAADRLVAGLRWLMKDGHGELLEAASFLSKQKVEDAESHIEYSYLPRAGGNRKIDAAIRALKQLAN